MSQLILYIKSHYFNSTNSAVSLARSNPSIKNIDFATKLVQAKMVTAHLLEKKTANHARYRNSQQHKYQSLSKQLKKIVDCKAMLAKLSQNPIDEKRIQSYYNLSSPSKKHFAFYMLSKFNLHNKDLRACNFSSANHIYHSRDKPYLKQTVDFSGSNLNNVNFENAAITRANFKNASMVGTTLVINVANTTPNKLPAFDFTDAILHHADFRFRLPRQWNNENTDLLLNNINNETGTLFHIIDTIDDKYADVKIKLLQQIVVSLNKDRYISSGVMPIPKTAILNYITAKKYYIEDQKIKSSIHYLIKDTIREADKSVILQKYNDNYLSLLLSTVENVDNDNHQSYFLLSINNFFIQLIVTCMHRDNLQLQQHAQQVYNTYLKQSPIKKVTEKNEFGNGEGEPDWSDKNSPNYILLNNDKAILIDHENLVKMLRLETNSGDIKWNNFYFYQQGECQAPNNINYEILFNQDFRIFSDSYRYDQNKSNLTKLVSILNLAEYESRFLDVLFGKPVTKDNKLIAPVHQLRLSKLFNKVMTSSGNNAKETILKPEHYQNLLNIFQYEFKSTEQKAQLLFSLATIFAKYSSSRLFGTETESPQILRNYTDALLTKAYELSPSVTGDHYDTWKAELLGLDSAFTCSAVLSSAMIEYAGINFNSVLSEVLPPLWK